MRVRILGPLEVLCGDQWTRLNAARWRSLLATLIVHAGQPVSVDRLVDELWPAHPPGSAANQVYGAVLRLRRFLGDAGGHLIRSLRPGYELALSAGDLDTDRFEDLAEQGHRALRDGRAEDATRLLAEALDLWRGPAYADVPPTPAIVAEVRRLEERHMSVLERRIDADLTLGRHATLTAELQALADANPFREATWAQLMLALHRSGRQADALAAYQQLYRTLDAELGVRPGNAVRALHQRMLAGDPALDQPSGQRPQSAAQRPRPRQLPAANRHFVGREYELKTLDELATAREDAKTIVITAIDGTAGIGKTTAAVYWAHQVTDRFPDGQLYVNLRGFDPIGSPLRPDQALRGFLEAFGVPRDRVPQDLAALSSLYRSLVADLRILVVLDNAADVEQVRPLLPGGPECLVIVTSRNRLTGLVAAEAAHPITLGLLSDTEAEQLLSRRLGPDRIDAEPQAVAAIIGYCARLPLALTIVAARAAVTPNLPLAALAGQLSDAGQRLDTLDAAAGPATDVRSVFSWSYTGLTAPAQQLFRLLGLHPGPEISAPAAASLAGVPLARARKLLGELTRAHLISEHVVGRYSFHDLLRAYARELADQHESVGRRHTAQHRMLDHYLHTAHRADSFICPNNISQLSPRPPQPGVEPEHITDRAHALSWLHTERQVIVAIVELAYQMGFDAHAAQLPQTLAKFFFFNGSWRDSIATLKTALRAAERSGDVGLQIATHRQLAEKLGRLTNVDDAYVHLQRADALLRKLDDRIRRAELQLEFGWLLSQQGKCRAALRHAEHALDVYRVTDDQLGRAKALNNAGWYHAQLGEYGEALALCRQALALFQELGRSAGVATTWHSLGYIHDQLGSSTSEAADAYRHAAEILHEIGDRNREAEMLTHLGTALLANEDPTAARTAWQQALRILEDLGHDNADALRTKLAELT